MKTLFTTPRLSCRRWVRSDLDSIYAVYSDEEGSRWVDDGQPIEYRECERWMDVTLTNYKTRGYGMFAVDETKSGQTIGFCGLVHPGGQPVAEVKYAFLRSHWGKGFASEIIPALLAWGKSEHGINEVIATVAPENLASQRVLAKAGMRYTHTRENESSQTLVFAWP